MKITPYILICWSALSESPKYAACRISMSDMSAFSDAAHFQNWHQQSDKSYFQWRDPILLNINFTEISFIYHSCRLFFPFDFLSLHLRFQSVILESIVGQDFFEWNLFLEENSKGIFFSFSVNRKSTKVQNNILMSLYPITSLLWKRDWLNMFERRCHQIRPLLTVCSSIFHHFVIRLPQSSSGWVPLFFRH